MITKKQIQAIVENIIDQKNQFIVDISVKPSSKIIIIVDDYKNITIDKCAEISRSIDKILNRGVEDYELEVTSPGLTQPFRVLQQYKKNIGKDIEILLKTGIKTKAKLISFNEKGIGIELEKNIKQKITENLFIDFDNIKNTKLSLSFT